MAERPGHIELKQLIENLLFESGEDDSHKYMMYKSHGIRALKEFHMDITREVKTVALVMDSIKSVELPSDYINWTKVGLQIGDKIKAFIPDNQIALNWSENNCGDKQVNASATDYYNSITETDLRYPVRFWNITSKYNDYGEYAGGDYGYGAGPIRNGFRINDGRIYFNSDVNTTVVYLEYISNGFNPSEQSLVPETCEDAIRMYIKWKEASFSSNKGGPAGREAMGWQQQYRNAVRLAKARLSPITTEGVLHASRNYAFHKG